MGEIKEEIFKVFISYSWSSKQHEEWVLNLAERLINDGIDVILDKWDLKKGQDKYTFMESMVNSSEINKVLIISDQTYQTKADSKIGGVGTETLIISPNVYENVAQEKFIPLVRELCDEQKPYLPIYLKGRIYIDFSDDSNFEIRYEELIRDITKRPASKKPRIGKLPSYLSEENNVFVNSSLVLRGIENSKGQNMRKVILTIKDYLERFFEDLDTLKENPHQNDTKEFGRLICESIHEYTPLRDGFIRLMDFLLRDEIEVDYNIFISFFERLYSYSDKVKSHYAWDNDHFKFMIHEMFLNFIALCLKYRNYSLIQSILQGSYFINSYSSGTKEMKSFDAFNLYIESINKYYNETYSLNFYSPMADLMSKRISTLITLENILDADILCHYCAAFNDLRWFPITYIYRPHNSKIEFIERMISKQYFEKIKGIFSKETAEEFLEKAKEISEIYSNRNYGYSRSYSSVPNIHFLLEKVKVASKP